MIKISVLVMVLLIHGTISVMGQQQDSLMQQIKSLSKETDPSLSTAMMKKIIVDFHLVPAKDAETIDMLKGTVAMDYLEGGNYREFDKMIASLSNKFNQTSYLSMAAVTLVDKKKDLNKAEALAKRTLDLYNSFKDDPKARPKDISEEDWKRFMDFAYYPYCDTYAMALHAVGKNKEALDYQEKAFNGSVEEGMPGSLERYSKLLVLNDQEAKAYSLLLKMAERGKSTEEMNELLKKLYLKKNNDEVAYDRFFSELQKNVVTTLKEDLKKKMQDEPAPAFSLVDLDGNTVSLADFTGKTVVIDFWATWCAPCKASFPAMNKMMQRHPDVQFLFIATQEKQDGAADRVKKYITANNYPFHVLMDKVMEDRPQMFQALSAYKVEGIPTKVIIDAKGNQRFFSVGFTSDTELMNEMEAMLQLVSEVKS